jgi:hypothetical protein
MTRGRALGLVRDCREPEAVAQFWAAALGHDDVGSVENCVQSLLRRVPEWKVGKNRMHLDIEVPDIGVLATRLEGLGAQRLRSDVVAEHGSWWFLMADTEGNELYVGDGGQSRG